MVKRYSAYDHVVEQDCAYEHALGEFVRIEDFGAARLQLASEREALREMCGYLDGLWCELQRQGKVRRTDIPADIRKARAHLERLKG